MGSRERRERHKIEVKNQILEVSQKVASKEGWESLTMRRIAAEIEYTLPVIYSHFNSKEDIITQLADRGFMLLRESLLSLYSEEKTLDKLVIDMANGYCKFAKQEQALYQAMFGLTGVSSFTEGNPKEGENLFYFIRDLLDTIVSKKMAKIPDTWQETKIIWSALHGLITLDFIDRIVDPHNSVESLTKEMVQILLLRWKDGK